VKTPGPEPIAPLQLAKDGVDAATRLSHESRDGCSRDGRERLEFDEAACPVFFAYRPWTHFFLTDTLSVSATMSQVGFTLAKICNMRQYPPLNDASELR
jgi:hypothetical protein